jgi:hypothetical protein
MRDTIDMAREAGFAIDESLGVPYALINEKTFVEFNAALERLVALARADKREQGQKWFDAVTAQHKQLILAEREACAKVCETHAPTTTPTWVSYAAAIRARGQA